MTNASYDNAYNTLDARFAGRGAAGSALTALAEQERRDMRAKLENPGAYAFTDIMENDRDDYYRTGYADGRNIMTVDDVIRLYRDERCRRTDPRAVELAMMEKERADRTVSTEQRPAHPYGVSVAVPASDRSLAQNVSGRRETVFSGRQEREMKVEPTVRYTRDRILALTEKWVGKGHTVNAKKSYRKTSSAIAAISLCCVFMLVLALPIALSVLIHNESVEISALNGLIKEKEAEVQALEIELDSKNDLFLIEELAVEKYGMVSLDNSTYKLITVHPADAIEYYSAEKENGGAVLALLNALGLRGSGN